MRRLRCSPDGEVSVRYASVLELGQLEQQRFEPEPMSEGGFLCRHEGSWHLGLSMCPRVVGRSATYCHRERLGPDNQGPYDVVVASASGIQGPYGPRYTALTHGGHGNFFADRDGQWWGCVFAPPRAQAPAELSFSCRPALVPMKWEHGRIMPDPNKAADFYEG